MTHEAPSITQATPLPSGTQVLLSWILPGDTPAEIQIFRDSTPITNLPPGQNTFTVGGLPSGTIANLSVCCNYEDGGPLFCTNVQVRTAGPPPSGGGTSPPPVITNLDPEPATITQGNRITVTWQSSIHYDKFLVWWTKNGVALQQGEIDSGGTSGSWTAAPTVPGAHYTFAVEGGVWGGILGNYNYSGWGPTKEITAVPNLTSLRQFLQHSGINPNGIGLRSLMPSGGSLRTFMKL